MTDPSTLGWTALSFATGIGCCVLACRVAATTLRPMRAAAADATAHSIDASLQRTLRRMAVAGIAAQLIALLGVTWLFATMFFALGGREAPSQADIIAPRLPLLLVGYPAGAALAATYMVLRKHNGAYAGERLAMAAAETVALMCLGGTIEQTNGGEVDALGVIILPLVARTFGIVASIGGVFAVKVDGGAAFPALRRGLYATLFASAVGLAGAAHLLLGPYWPLFGACGLLGIAATLAVLALQEPRQPWQIALLGSAVVLACHLLGDRSGLSHAAPFGIAIAAGGVLSASAYLHAMSAFSVTKQEDGPLVFAAAQARDLTRAHAAFSSLLVLFAVTAAYLDATAQYACTAAAACDPLSRAPLAIDIATPAVLAAALAGGALVARLATPRLPPPWLVALVVVAPLPLGLAAARMLTHGPDAIAALLLGATATTLFLTRRTPVLPIATLAMATLALLIAPLVVG